MVDADAKLESARVGEDLAAGWYYEHREEAVGPLDRAEIEDALVRGELSLETRVWHPAVNAWAPLGEVLAAAAIVLDVDRLREPASIGRRLLAFTVDAFIIGWLLAMLSFVLPVLAVIHPLLALLTPLAVLTAYFTVLESSPVRGTLGKAALELDVVDEAGRRITFRTACVRFAAKALWLVMTPMLLAANPLAPLPLRPWHDRVAGTRVVRRVISSG